MRIFEDILRDPFWALCLIAAGAILGWLIEWFLFDRRNREREQEWRTKFATADSARSKLEVQLGETRAELDPLRLQVTEGEKRLGALTADLNASADARAKLDADLANLRPQLAERETKLGALTADLKASADARAKLDAELANLRAQLAERETKLGALTADLKASADARTQLDADLANLRAQLAERETKLGALTADFKASADARTQLDADLTQKLGLLAGATALTATLRGDVDSQRSRADAAEAGLADLRTQLAERINLHHHTEAELAALRAELLAVQQRAGTADADFTARSARFNADLGDWRQRAEGAETELASLRAQLTEKAGLLAGADVLSAQMRGDLDNWRLRAEGAETELANLRAHLAEGSARHTADLDGWRLRAEGAETELANLRAQAADNVTRFDSDLGALRVRAEGAEAELNALRARAETAEAELATVHQKLAVQLNRADTLEEQARDLDDRLAAAGSLQTELTAARSQLSDVDVQLGQKTEQLEALERELAQLRANAAGASALGLAAGALAAGDDGRGAQIEREAADLRALLADRVHTLHQTEAELARLRAEVIEARSAVVEMETELAEVMTERAAPTRAASPLNVLAAAAEPERDELIIINGIGPVFEKRLNDAGIFTFAQLADTPDERILEIIKAKKWQAVDAPFWRRQARDFAAQKTAGTFAVAATSGDELILINGIGPVFERRLKNAGILTFAQLAETPNERILEVVRAKSWQAVDADFWRRQAREYAATGPAATGPA